MASKEYYELLLKCKKQLKTVSEEDSKLQQLATSYTGLKPQATSVEIVARVYCKYCDLYNKMCEIYDQMLQPQRQVYIKKIIDAITCRLLELKSTLEKIEAFEYTYCDGAMQQMIITPDEVQILCPFFYPFETRKQEMQYLVDEILAGNRLGDPTPTPSEIERREEARIEKEERIRAEKEAVIKLKMARGEEIVESEPSVVFTPEQLEQMRQLAECTTYISNIQRMERARLVIFNKIQKVNKDHNTYLELAGLKKPKASEVLRTRAASFIQKFYRQFMLLKREHYKENQLRAKLGMIIQSWQPPSQKIQLQKVREVRRAFRRQYFQKWIEANIKEKSRIFRLKRNYVIDDITSEIRQWWRDWYDDARVFDEYPWPLEGGSILVVKGETFTLPEYFEWKKTEEKRLKQEEGTPTSPEEKKARKKAEREEKKRIALEEKEKEKKRLIDYKKSRFHPDNDPGVYIEIGEHVDLVHDAIMQYNCMWKSFDIPNPTDLNVIKGHIMQLITEDVAQELHLELRPIVDEMLKLELGLLRAALKTDYANAKEKVPITKKRKKPRKEKPPKPDKSNPAHMFQQLVDQGIVMKYPRTTLEDYWGDRNYAAAEMRAVMWTPKFPPPCIGDVQEQVRVRCLLTLGCSCPNADRSQLLVGPKGSGKRTLAYAIATETNSILINLSPRNVYNKLPGAKGLKDMFTLVSKVSRLMQPTVILVGDADKMFYKKVPPEEKEFDPTRLSKDFYKDITKTIKGDDKILVIGTASEPWLAAAAKLRKVFPSVILIPRTDYGSISYVLTRLLMKYHSVQRNFNVHSVAQALRGYDINSIIKCVQSLLKGSRIAELAFKPLHPREIVNAVLADENAVFTDSNDYDLFQQWYLSYSEFGTRYRDCMEILESQLVVKLKADSADKKK